MASKLVQITDVDKAWELWEAGLLVNVNGRPWFSIDEMLESLSYVQIGQQFPKWIAPKKDGGGYVYVEEDENPTNEDEDC